ncbi:ECF transporter S component [Orenia marismortui]|uniref:ECF transporter S component n=1 Tax=Orenia marismortui TaxID=46469 RepID=UPI00035C932F|nr:ECF transporter S component [Orenia marismortui]
MKGKVDDKKIASLVKSALLIALSGVGAYLKFPSPVGSIAFDSLPGYLGVLLLGGKFGSVILIFGHLISALIAGFVLGPFHIIIALLMGVCGLIFGYLAKTNIILAAIIAIVCNGIILPALLIPFLGQGLFIGIVTMLTLASAANIFLAVILNKFFSKE